MSKLLSVFITLALLLWNSEATTDVNLSCMFETRVVFSTFGLQPLYGCSANSKDLIGQVKVVGASGEHEEDESTNKEKSNDDVNFLFLFSLLNNKDLTKFPSNIENIFKNLKVLVIANSSITEITESDIKPLSQLTVISITNSKIEVIRKDLFKNHPNMEIIHLTFNNIKHIDRDVFNDLKALRMLGLEGNNCSSLSNATNKQQIKTLVEKINNGACESVEYITENPKDVAIREQQQQIDELMKQVKPSDDQEDIFVIINQEVTQEINDSSNKTKKT